MADPVETNRALWNAWTPHHVRSAFYDVPGFKAGRDTLDPISTRLMGPVDGLSLLHLQCHFGLDTLSWARRGARVTGVDFSPPAIEAARELAGEIGLEARFVLSTVAALEENLEATFDRVFTSHGVLTWLPDLESWATAVGRFLKPGGKFVIVEGHPVLLMFDEEAPEGTLRVRYPYFGDGGSVSYVERGSYAAPDAPLELPAHFWIHSLADIQGSLRRAGLIIETFEEHPVVSWAALPGMVQDEDGWWRLPEGMPALPLTFALTARKPERT